MHEVIERDSYDSPRIAGVPADIPMRPNAEPAAVCVGYTVCHGLCCEGRGCVG